MSSEWFNKIIPPMLAVKGRAFNSPEYLYEIKWDGTRCIAFIDVKNKRQRLQNRRLMNITYRYPELKLWECLEKNAVIDGEIVVFEGGKPSFHLLQKREHVESRLKIDIISRMYPAVFIAFDVLYIEDDGWIMDKPLKERKDILSDFDDGDGLILSEFIIGEGKRYYNKAIDLGLEGVMAKMLDSPYIPGKRVSFWVKIKKRNTVDCVIVGYLEGEGEREGQFGSLILGLYNNGKYIHVGQVGTGFDSETMKLLSKKLEQIKTDTPPLSSLPQFKRKVQWVKPVYVCEVEYLELTEGRKLRAPVFIRLRSDKKPEECTVDQINT